MSNVISISSRLHRHKRKFIVRMIVNKLDLDTADDHLARAMQQPKGRTNHDIVFFMVDINYPSPNLGLEVDNEHIVATIIDNMSYRCGFSLQRMEE